MGHPIAAGERLVSVYKGQPGEDGEPIQDNEVYDVAIVSFLAKGGDGYQMIPDTLEFHKNTGFLDNDLIVNYLKRKSPINLPKSGRILFSSGTRYKVSQNLALLSPLFVAILKVIF